MNRSLKRSLVPALGIFAAVSLGFAQDGTGGNRGPVTPAQPVTGTLGAPVPSANILLGTAQGGFDGVLMTNVASGAVSATTFPGLFNNASGASWLTGTPIFSMTGGNGDGGNLYHFLGNGNLLGPFATGFTSVPGSAWINSGGALVGSAAFATIGDALINIDPFTGVGAVIGGGYGSGIGGIDGIAQNPLTGQIWGSTGFFYDGSAGDEIAIDFATGTAMDGGVDMFEASGAGPACTVSGMTFDVSGQGYISTGCGGGGTVYEWTPGGTIVNLGVAATGSMNDIIAVF